MRSGDAKTVVEIVDRVPEIGGKIPEISGKETAKKRGSAKRTGGGSKPERTDAGREEKTGGGAKKSTGQGKKRAKARSGSEKLTPAALYRKMIAFGKIYQVEKEQDFIEAARIYAEEAGLIDRMRDQIAEDGLTVMKTYKTGDMPVAHPLLAELPRHVESANKCLATIGNMIGERGARVEKAARDLDAFRLHVR